ncbi:Lysine ketoglutarate reductase trans-splicing-like protein [Heracleum sosnowskyi]|uniref:Lysine ketoglutarate reductase trans-splicing-like protein n=1 Tax=Heracleum sosnowskyi TaxID=360622 RepID=A0AAD8IRV9_9APIA|nr:Lysine ketoglutarate reductase trans-splicing-like protein [Heracleum sosnowskyi]
MAETSGSRLRDMNDDSDTYSDQETHSEPETHSHSLSLVSVLTNPTHRRSCFCGFFPAVSMLGLVFFFLGSSFVTQDDKLNQCRRPGSEALPKGIVSETSNFERRPLWGYPKNKPASNLFSVAVGTKQKEMVDTMVRKFLASNFVVMLFHYDGIVDEWKEFDWSNDVIHVSAINQTKWWFAKRFLHPDVVADYSYIFLWDEDLGVENFDPGRYLSIITKEGLEISQPGLDPKNSELHHQITARGRKSDVHRRIYKPGNNKSRCDDKSTKPPCTGWIEVMAPVFSKAAWRCVWHMMQNDFVHAWGLDMQLGYCAQGDRTKNVGVVDAEYIVHHGIPTLGGSKDKTKLAAATNASEIHPLASLETNGTLKSGATDFRIDVRRQSYNEYKVFRRRWIKAAAEDKCWVDQYPGSELPVLLS